MDYLSYTTEICQLLQWYSLVSVLLYDREYRKLQCHHNFRWGTDVPHMHSVYLQPRIPHPNQPLKGTGGYALRPSTTSSPSHHMARLFANCLIEEGVAITKNLASLCISAHTMDAVFNIRLMIIMTRMAVN